MDITETVVATESIYEGKVIHLRVDTVKLPDGRMSKREIVGHGGAVCIVPLTADGAILMVRQFRLAAGKALLEVPAGTLEAGEEPAECAARELEEETGYSAQSIQPLFAAYLAPGYSTEVIHAFVATGLAKCSAPASMDADENIALERIDITEIEAMIMRGELQDSKSIASILTALRLTT